MKKLLFALSCAVSAISTQASAAEVLAGNNSLPLMVHADPSQPSVGTTVYGITDPGVQVAFTGTSILQITGGMGYAQIGDGSSTDGQVLDDLSFTLTNYAFGFTGLEFTIQYPQNTGSQSALTIFTDFLGGAPSQSFLIDPVGNGAKDFRVLAQGNEVFWRIRLASDNAFDQIKQTDIRLAAAPVPEPATWAMMILGFGLIGAAMRRKRTGLATA